MLLLGADLIDDDDGVKLGLGLVSVSKRYIEIQDWLLF